MAFESIRGQIFCLINEKSLNCRSRPVLLLVFPLNFSPFFYIFSSSLFYCSDPTCGGGGNIYSNGFFCSVNFGRPIYSS